MSALAQLVLSCLFVFTTASLALAEDPKARILLTFDDGPSTRTSNNPSKQILQVLDHNPVQDGIKAIFFTQSRLNDTRHAETTRQLLQQEFEKGHLLAIHSGVLKGHSDHRKLDDVQLGEFLAESKLALEAFTGEVPQLIRPTYWAFSERTRLKYEEYHLHMLLTDVSVSDGKSWGYRANLRRRSVLEKQMQAVHQRIANGSIPEVDGLLPIVVTFHDTNTWTASHMSEYLELLVSSASGAGIVLDKQAFYAHRAQLSAAAIQRSLREENPSAMVPSRWRSFEKFCIWSFCSE